MNSNQPVPVGGDPTYVMERGDVETQRLIRQAAYREPLTRRLFSEAGITKGMNVLDLGAGAGDVAFLAAELVGPTGSVLGIDTDPEVLRTARARASAAELDNVTFVEQDLRSLDPGEGFDAVVGRLVLMYVADPAEALRTVSKCLTPGGIVAMQELNWLRDSVVAFPPTPLWEQTWSWMRETVRHSGIDIELGYKLYRSFVDAGLPEPEMLLQAKVASGSDPDVYEYAADTLRNMLPTLLSCGIATEDEVDIDTLAQRLQAETLASGGVIKASDMVGAHTRTAS